MTDTFRALCAELLDVVAKRVDHTYGDNRLMKRARAALAQPEPARQPTFAELLMPPPRTAEELLASVRHFYGDQTAADMGAEDDLRTARAVLARWGTPAIQPVPVSERLPGPDDWDTNGRCWMFDPCDRGWWAYRSALPSDDELGRPPWTHWLPHWALPRPCTRQHY
jgi:hypothetical protein